MKYICYTVFAPKDCWILHTNNPPKPLIKDNKRAIIRNIRMTNYKRLHHDDREYTSCLWIRMSNLFEIKETYGVLRYDI